MLGPAPNIPLAEYAAVDGIELLFRQQVQRQPKATAIVDGERILTYEQLDLEANRLAIRLLKRGIRLEEPVCILTGRTSEHIIAQVAIIRCGGSCVPLDPSLPDQRLIEMSVALGSSLLITLPEQQQRLPQFEKIVISGEAKSLINPIHNTPPMPVNTGAEHCTHILHTSGTSGRPKAVQVLSRGIVRLTQNIGCIRFSATDRVGHLSSPSFDASLFEIWATLVRGATVVILPKEVVIDPPLFSERLRHYHVSLLWLTTALFNLTAFALPGAFTSLEYVITGGEVANPHAMQRVLECGPPKTLINAYGPTECTTFALFHPVTLKEARQGTIAIGSPIDRTFIYILDEHRRPVKGNETGELFIGGEGVARGYFNSPEQNAKCFVEVNGLASEEPVRLYKTGDMVRWGEPGIVHYVGRTDDQVKIRRIEIKEIESVLLNSGQLKTAAVVTVLRPDKETYMVAYIIPSDPEHFLATQLEEYLRRSLPDYMLPRIEALDEFPMTSHGKVDRKQLIEHHLQRLQRLRDPSQHVEKQDTVVRLSQLWQQVLNVPCITPEDDFFSLGGSSLQAASMIVQVRKCFGKMLSVQTIYDYPTLGALAGQLDGIGDGKSATRNQNEQMLADAELERDIEPLSGEVPDWHSKHEGRVFLTGATGFLGAFVLRLLINSAEVKRVVCLVRTEDSTSGLRRVCKNLQKYGLGQKEHLSKISALPGDLADDNFGISREHFGELAKWASVIFHLGAHVNYIQPYSIHRPANVIGTLNILRFATTGRPKPLHYVSSIAAYGPTGFFTGTRSLNEDEPLARHLNAIQHDMGYSQSQWVAEQMVHSVREKGVPAAIYRPGFIMGDSVSGNGNPDDFMARLLVGCVVLGSYPRLLHQRKEFVPVDYVSRALFHIASSSENLGRAYNLVPLDNTSSVDLQGTFDLLAQCGHRLDCLPYQDWVERLSQDAGLSENPLMPLLPMLKEPVSGQLTRWELYEHMPIYETTNTRKALSDFDGPPFPVFDGLLLSRYLDSWAALGLIDRTHCGGPGQLQITQVRNSGFGPLSKFSKINRLFARIWSVFIRMLPALAHEQGI